MAVQRTASLPSRWISKIHGLTRPIIEEAIARTREARMHILDDVMKPVIDEPRKHLSIRSKRFKQISIDPQKIGDMVGKQVR